MIAALYVETGGAYYDLPDVDPWDLERDARQYAGPWPVVAHPPCKRWGRYWNGGPSARVPRRLGDDDGCFAAALEAVRRWGGVLEHPEASHAWRVFGLNAPPRHGGWVRAGIDDPGWTCCVEQGAYGHRARKATWLYAVGCELPSLAWGRADGDFARLDEGHHSAAERRRAVRTGACQRLSRKQRLATPEPFRDLLISMARSVQMGIEMGIRPEPGEHGRVSTRNLRAGDRVRTGDIQLGKPPVCAGSVSSAGVSATSAGDDGDDRCAQGRHGVRKMGI